ncbi:hypothetical protein BD310DRAFT_923720, partial [Dichomitus squalens]
MNSATRILRVSRPRTCFVNIVYTAEGFARTTDTVLDIAGTLIGTVSDSKGCRVVVSLVRRRAPVLR